MVQSVTAVPRSVVAWLGDTVPPAEAAKVTCTSGALGSKQAVVCSQHPTGFKNWSSTITPIDSSVVPAGPCCWSWLRLTRRAGGPGSAVAHGNGPKPTSEAFWGTDVPG